MSVLIAFVQEPTITKTITMTTEQPPVQWVHKRVRFDGTIRHNADGQTCIDMGNGAVCFGRDVWALWDCDPEPGTAMSMTIAFWLDRMAVECLRTIDEPKVSWEVTQ